MKRPEPSTPTLAARVGTLSPREREILSLMALGLSNREIATRRFATVYAVKYHVSSIYQKLGVANRTEAAVLYLKVQGDIPEPGESSRPPIDSG